MERLKKEYNFLSLLAKVLLAFSFVGFALSQDLGPPTSTNEIGPGFPISPRLDPNLSPVRGRGDPSYRGRERGLHPWRSASMSPIEGTILTIDDPSIKKCPPHWIQNEDTCYKFVRSPVKNRNNAKLQCEVR